MIKKLLVFTLCVLSVSFMTGCSDDDPTGPEQVDGPTDGIIPLNIGAQWEYTQYNNTDTTSYVELITGVESYGDIDHYIRGFQYTGSYANYEAIRILDAGLRIYPIVSNSIYSDYYYELPYPASVGDEFTYFIDGDNEIQGRVESVSEDVTVDLGTFNCYHYYVWNDDNFADIYYSPGVGLIKEVSVQTAVADSTGPRVTELLGTENVSY